MSYSKSGQVIFLLIFTLQHFLQSSHSTTESSYPCTGYFDRATGELQIQHKENLKFNLPTPSQIASCTSLDIDVQPKELDIINWDSVSVLTPHLIEFNIKFTTDRSQKVELIFSKPKLGNLKRILFFELGREPWELEQLWSLGVSINILINSHLLLAINHRNESFYFAPKYEIGPNPIVRSLGHSKNLQSLTLLHADIDKELNFEPTALRELFYSYVTIPNAIDFVSRCVNLEKLTGPLFGELDLTKDLVSPKLQTVTLYDPHVFCSPPTTTEVNGFLTELHLSKSILDSSFEKNFWRKFPNIRRISLTPTKELGSPITPSILKSILDNLPHIRWIKITLMDWTASSETVRAEMREFLDRSHGDLKGNEVDFVLERREGNNRWNGRAEGY